MALADVLQWADAARVRGMLTVARPSGPVWMKLEDRHVRLTGLSPSQPVSWDEGSSRDPLVTQRELAVEHLYDQFLDTEGSFTFDANTAPPEAGVEVEAFLPELLMEGLRYLDEWPRLDDLYPSDAPRLHVGSAPLPENAPALKRQLTECARQELTLSDARLSVGLSRPAFLRRIDELRALDHIVVDGTPSGGDLIAKLVSQAVALLAAKQFDEAAHVFSALLATDPGAPRVKSLLERAEREQLEWLRDQVPTEAVPIVAQPGVDRRTLSDSDRVLLNLINGSWNTGVLVLYSPLREKESLKALRKLTRLGVIRLRQA